MSDHVGPADPTDPARPTQLDAVVVGAGFAGMYMLHRLRRSGFSTRAFEAGTGVGGTWYWNRYPGARCDVESMDYSYSFDPELEQEWEWSERYATQPEILRYAEHVADRHDLRRDIQFETRVTTAAFDDATSRWTVTTDRGEVIDAQFLIMAVGCLSASKKPEIAGVDDFGGPTYHTGHWPHEGVDFTGQRVAVIGTGSSGIQSIPLIAQQAAQLTVFQRTANYSSPALNAPLDPEHVAKLKANYPEHRQRARESRGGVPVEIPTERALEATPEERDRKLRAGWQKGTLFAIGGAYADVALNLEANDIVASFIRDRIKEKVADPALAETLSPRDHPYGTKRPCLDTNYFETYNEDHVDLVDLRATPIEAITPTGIRTTDGESTFDSIVFATGFDAMTGPILGVDITGRKGASLREAWVAGPRTYLGLGVAGFPNLFTITGPGSPSVLSNMMVSIEQHVEWIDDCLIHLRQFGRRSIEPTLEAQDAWVDHGNAIAAMTLMQQTNSWYMGANVPGKPRVFMPYAGGVGAYRERCDNVAANGYDGFTLAG